MEVREITDKNIWESFFSQYKEKTFLQSWNWGEFCAQDASGSGEQLRKIWRFGIFKNNNLVSVALVSKIIARRGTFLFIAHQVLVSKEVLETLLGKLKEIAKQEKANFIRIAPLIKDSQENLKIFKDLGFIFSPMHASAYEATWKLDIALPEERLLSNMRKTTRYLIKKCQENKDIEIKVSTNLQDIKIYQALNKEVAKRQKFVGFSDKYIENEFEVFNKDNEVVFIFGKYLPDGSHGNEQVVAGAMVIFWQGVAFYHQAASLGKFAKLSVPYLLQWTAIKEAKKRKCTIYDFWGFTDPEKFPKHPWAGPTLFKMGFGGEKHEYIKTQDYVISWKYWINYIIEKFRKLKRGL
jgi:lipid II:glycine glycyltransferase (peptidoglycan interpeptide bridge formation enzyme)